MPWIPKPSPRPSLRTAIAVLVVAAVAVAFGALHGGAATPTTQSVTVPSKAGKTVSVTWTGAIPPRARTRRATATAPASATTTKA